MYRRHLEDGGKKSSARNFVTNYVKSDAYKKRYKAAGVRGSEDDATKRIDNTTVKYIDNTENPIDASSHYKYITDNGYKNVVEIDNNARWMSKDNTEAHELGHTVDTTSGGYEPESYRTLYSKQRRGASYNLVDKQGNIISTSMENTHDRSSAEIYADLMQTRYDLNNRGIYDSTKDEPFTQEHLDAYIDALNAEGTLNQNRFMQGFDKDTIIDMMNTIAMNEPYHNYNNYAKYGARVKAENGFTTILPEIEVRPKLKPSEKRRIARRELMKYKLLSEMLPLGDLPLLAVY